MIPKQCKRLAEVDFPIAEVSKHASREKSIRHGHPSTLHLWWARRPLASSRAVLMALLLPDPADEYCPKEFKEKALKLLPEAIGEIGSTDLDLRKGLLKFIGQFANWDLSTDPLHLKIARELVKAVYPDEPPLVVDPFAGGGSIPLEALRLGCEAFASDLNPVAALILKVMLEIIPRHGTQLADELQEVGMKIKEEAEKELAEFYPNDPDGSRPIAYLWARTVRCEAPHCGAEIPLVRSFWLCKKNNRKKALRYNIIRKDGQPPQIKFEIFTPNSDSDVPPGSVSRAKATCLACGAVLPPDRVRTQLREQRGGADVIFDEQGNRIGGALLLAVVTMQSGKQGRNYRLPTENDYLAVWKAMKKLQVLSSQPLPNGLNPVPDEPLPPIGTLGFRVQRYGMLKWGDLFTARQKLALVNFLFTKNKLEIFKNNYNAKLDEIIGIVFSRISSFWSSLNMWVNSGEFVANVFGRQALPIVWDFCEVFPTTNESGGLVNAIDWVKRVIKALACNNNYGQAQLSDATEATLPDQTTSIWFTDPPYYDAIPYSDLSDFFFVWLKRILPGHPLLRDPFDPGNPLTPKIREIVQDETKQYESRPKDRHFFEKMMGKAFAEGKRVLREDGIGSVVFAHKTTEGWEALLTGLIRGGWTITASWPIATERPGRLRSQESAALATSIHLVCRPRPENAPVGDWTEVLRELPHRVGTWMDRLQKEGIRGADLVFACIGPALEIFSRYSRVETAEGNEITLAEYLEKVWEIVGRKALEQVLGTTEAQSGTTTTGALEEDARLTALFLWTLQSTNNWQMKNGNKENIEEDDDLEDEDSKRKKKIKGFLLIYDVARRFAQPLGIHLDQWDGRIIEIKKGVVRLLPVSERAKQLFGEDGVETTASLLESDPLQAQQLSLFPELEMPIRRKKKGRRQLVIDISADDIQTSHKTTTLDRLHAALLLQASGRTNALRALLKAELERSPEFLRLANALSALYPKGSEEKRLLDAMLQAMKR